MKHDIEEFSQTS